MKTERSNLGNLREKGIYVLAALLAVAVLVLLSLLLGRGAAEETEAGIPGSVKYESNVILDDAEGLQDAVDRMIEKAAEGQMGLELKVEAASSDGRNFSCYIGNSKANSYDMYLTLFLDETGEEVYRSGLIPVGGRIETFTTDRKLEKGTYEGTLVHNQVEVDGETLHAQVNVGLTLIVAD